MIPPWTQILFKDWGSYYEADDDLKGIYAAVTASPVASEHSWLEYRINHKGQLLQRHMIVVPGSIASRVVQG